MSIEARLHELAEHASNLVCCDGASVFLGCSDPALRHPLLNLSPRVVRGYSSTASYDERLAALCDIAMQTDVLWVSRHLKLHNNTAGGVAVVPLERPAGILGLLVLMDTRSEIFGSGEQALLVQYAPIVARQVEEMLVDACLLPLVDIGSKTLDVAPHTSVREQSELISMVSHELRMPLAAIKGYTVLLQAYGVPEEPGERDEEEVAAMGMTVARKRHYLNAILEKVKHLEVLVNDLLDMSRIRIGQRSLRRIRVDIAQICRQVAELVQGQSDQERPGYYCIRCSIDPQLPLVWADPDRVQQVLTNLLENAVKYSPGGGVIEIQASRDSGGPCSLAEARATHDTAHDQWESVGSLACSCVHVTVRDRGIGIADQQQAALFQPFTRLEHPLTRDVPGDGLGLYIARELVEAMGGKVLLKSCEGQGTSVTFTLPAEQSATICSSITTSSPFVSMRTC